MKSDEFLKRKGVKKQKSLRRKLAGVFFIAFASFMIFMIVGTALNLYFEEQDKRQLTKQQPAVVKQPITTDGLFLAVNAARQAHGVPTLSRNALLEKSAKLKCDEMKRDNYYEHVNPKTGKTGPSYIVDVGQYHGGSSENLNAGKFNNATEVITNWMESEAHKAAILDSGFSETGFATCTIKRFPGELVFVEHFIKPEPPQQPQQVQADTSTICTHHGSVAGVPAMTVCN